MLTSILSSQEHAGWKTHFHLKPRYVTRTSSVARMIETHTHTHTHTSSSAFAYTTNTDEHAPAPGRSLLQHAQPKPASSIAVILLLGRLAHGQNRVRDLEFGGKAPATHDIIYLALGRL